MEQFEREYKSSVRKMLEDREVGIREKEDESSKKIDEDALTLQNIDSVPTNELSTLSDETKTRLLNDHFYSIDYDLDELDQVFVENFVVIPDCQTVQECKQEVSRASRNLAFYNKNLDKLIQDRDKLVERKAFLKESQKELLELFRKRACEAQIAIWKQDKIIRALTARMEQLETEMTRT